MSEIKNKSPNIFSVVGLRTMRQFTTKRNEGEEFELANVKFKIIHKQIIWHKYWWRRIWVVELM